MRAVGVRHYGGPEVLELVQIPTPEPGAGEVRVRVHAAAINPADVMLRDGLLADSFVDVEPPFIPGMDVAGVIARSDQASIQHSISVSASPALSRPMPYTVGTASSSSSRPSP